MRIRRLGAALGAGALAAGFVALAAPAGAASKTFEDVSCTTSLGIPVTQDISVEIEAPAEVEAGTQFTMTIPSSSRVLPATNPSPPVTISSYKNLSTSYVVTGGSIVAGSASASGQPTINGTPTAGTATISGNSVALGVAGPIPPGTLVSPTVTFKVTAGGAGTQIKTNGGQLTVTVNIGADVAVTCDIPDDTLTTTTVVAPPPPPPGEFAPVPQNDTAITDIDTPVLIDVLANDTPHPDYAIFPAISTSEPEHGFAEEVDGQVLYEPEPGYTGGDSFEYLICSDVPEEVLEEFAPAIDGFEIDPELYCSTAFVSVTITAPTPPTTAGTTTPTSPSSTAAPVTTAAAELPKTGSGSSGLTIAGYAALVGGLAVLGAFRRRASA